MSMPAPTGVARQRRLFAEPRLALALGPSERSGAFVFTDGHRAGSLWRSESPWFCPSPISWSGEIPGRCVGAGRGHLGDRQYLGDIVEAGVQAPSEVGSGSPEGRRSIRWGGGHPAQSLSKRLVDERLEAASAAAVRAPQQRSHVRVEGQGSSHASKHRYSDALMSIHTAALHPPETIEGSSRKASRTTGIRVR